MIVEALYSQLSGDLAVTAAGPGGVWPQLMPQGVVPPAVTFSIDGDLPQRLTSGEASSLRTALVSVDCWAISVVAAHRLADAVEACLLPVHGAMGAEVPPQLVDDVQLERRFDLFETDSKLYRVSLQFSVAYYP